MASRSSKVRASVRTRSLDQCVYCHAPQSLVWGSHEIDHIIPPGAGGTDDEANLCLACRDCNLFKSEKTNAVDPLTGELTALFHPMLQQWNDHFCWDETRTRIEGTTATGRATVTLLNMNELSKISKREFWVSCEKFPPAADATKGNVNG